MKGNPREMRDCSNMKLNLPAQRGIPEKGRGKGQGARGKGVWVGMYIYVTGRLE